jgi:hypothetical protein
MRRTLVLIGKVLQNLANRRRFGSKEAFMAPLNTFIVNNEKSLEQWFKTLPVCRFDVLFIALFRRCRLFFHTNFQHRT